MFLSDRAKDFLQEEQKQRRNEIENLIGRIETDQRYGLAITGLVWSWLATHQEKLEAPLDVVAVFIPALVMLFFFLRWNALHKTILQVASYTKMVERLFEVPKEFGWETFVEKERGGALKKQALAKSTSLYWCLLVVANLILAVLFAGLTRSIEPNKTVNPSGGSGGLKIEVTSPPPDDACRSASRRATDGGWRQTEEASKSAGRLFQTVLRPAAAAKTRRRST